MSHFQIASVLVITFLTSITTFAFPSPKFIWQCTKNKDGTQITYRVALENFGGYSFRKYTGSAKETLITRTTCDFDKESRIFFCYRDEGPSLGGTSTYEFVPKAPLGSTNLFTLYDRTTSAFNLHYIINKPLDDDLECGVFISDSLMPKDPTTP